MKSWSKSTGLSMEKYFRLKFIDVESKPTFKETHTRVTTYIENNLHIIIKLLQEQNQIDSILAFINDSIRYYLMKEKNVW